MKHDPRQYRRVRMNQQMIDIFDEQKERFRRKFGRDPGPKDPVFFNEDTDEPQPMSLQEMEELEQEILDFLGAINVPPEFLHAFKVTGRLVTEMNLHLLSDEEIQEWTDAVEEYQRLHAAD